MLRISHPIAFATVLAALTTSLALSVPVIRPGSIDDLYEIDYGTDLRVESRSLRFAYQQNSGHTGSSSSLSPSSSVSIRSSSSGRSSASVLLDEGPYQSHVFRAIHRGPRGQRRPVIVKRIAIEHRSQALSEAANMVVLDDVPWAMRLYDVVEDGAHIYLVMQLFDGQTVGQHLTDLVARPDTTCDEVVAVLKRIAGVVARTLLAFLDYGFVHTDLHTLNVMIDADGNVIVLDLGNVRTFFDSWNPIRSGYESSPTPESYEQAQSGHFRRFLFTLFPIAAARFAAELQHWPLYNQVMNPLCPRPNLTALADPDLAGLRGANAARRYGHSLQSVKLRALLYDDRVRPVLDHERGWAADQFRLGSWARRLRRSRSSYGRVDGRTESAGDD